MKKIYQLSLLPLALSAQNINYSIHNTHGFTIPSQQIEVVINNISMNDTLDILKLKQQEFSGSTLSATSIGDLSGYGLEVRYGATDSLMVALKRENMDISYGSNTLNNIRNEIFVRKSFKTGYSKAVALDIGLINNKGGDIKLTDVNQINSEAGKFINGVQAKYTNSSPYRIVAPNVTYLASNGDEVTGDIDITATVTPFVSTEKLEDNSLYIKGISSWISGNHIVDIYTAFTYTKITTYIDSSINQEAIKNPTGTIATALKLLGQTAYRNLDRDEKKLTLGANYSYSGPVWTYEINYEFDKLFRDRGLDYRSINHKLQASIGYLFTKNTMGFVSAKAMTTQFNGEIPYLYNKYSQTSFDHRYGYVKAGCVVKF